MVAHSLPYWPIDPSLTTNPWFTFQLDLLRSLWAVFPATLLWGASFPLALASIASRGQDGGRLVGGVYAANTLGAIVGALALSILVIPWRGTQDAQRVLVAIAAISACVALIPLLWSRYPVNVRSSFNRLAPRIIGGAALAASLIFIVWRVREMPKVPPGLVAHGRYLPTTVDARKILYVGEGMSSSVAVSELSGYRYFHVAGKVEASSDPQDMRLQRMLGHIPALLHPNPQKVLVVGCGAGVTAGSFLTYPSLQSVTICEIEPLIPRVVSTYFKKENYNVVDDPHVSVVFDDARHYVLTSDQTYDIITSDPINPWVKGAATLYTHEYFEMCKRHLTPGGMVTQWVPLYESTPEAVKSEIATFFEVFPNGTIWSNDESGRGYDIVLLGQVEPLRIDVDALEEKLASVPYAHVRKSLKDVNFHSAIELLATYGARAVELSPWLANAQINRDRNLRLQYLAGMGMNSYHEGFIYEEMVKYRKFPDDLFIGTALTRAQLRHQIQFAKPATP